MTQIATDAVDERITKEVELLLERCARSGIAVEAARASLVYQVFRLNMEAGIASEAAREEPLTRLLKDAYRYQMAGKKALHLETCEAWLLAKVGAKLGDVVELEDEDEPRQIMLDGFRILWMKYDGIAAGYMWLKGPCSDAPLYSANPTTREQGVPLGTALRVVKPSDKLVKRYPERFMPKIKLPF